MLGKAKVDKAIFWCGSLAHDIDYTKNENFKNTEIHQVFASKDPYYKSDFPDSQIQILKSAGIDTKMHIFEGGHEVSVQLMKEALVL